MDTSLLYRGRADERKIKKYERLVGAAGKYLRDKGISEKASVETLKKYKLLGESQVFFCFVFFDIPTCLPIVTYKYC